MATEGKYISGVIKYECNRNFCRKVITLAAAQTFGVGKALKGTITFDAAGSGDTITAIALEAAVASVPPTILALVRGPAIVVYESLTSARSEANTKSNLLSRDILVENSPTYQS